MPSVVYEEVTNKMSKTIKWNKDLFGLIASVHQEPSLVSEPWWDRASWGKSIQEQAADIMEAIKKRL